MTTWTRLETYGRNGLPSVFPYDGSLPGRDLPGKTTKDGLLPVLDGGPNTLAFRPCGPPGARTPQPLPLTAPELMLWAALKFLELLFATTAESAAARQWSSLQDTVLWGRFIALSHLPAPERYKRLVQGSGRSLSAIQQRLKLLRKDPPSLPQSSVDDPEPTPVLSDRSSPSNPHAVWTTDEEARLWSEFHTLDQSGLKRTKMWARLARAFGRTAKAVAARVTLLKRRGWPPPAIPSQVATVVLTHSDTPLCPANELPTSATATCNATTSTNTQGPPDVLPPTVTVPTTSTSSVTDASHPASKVPNNSSDSRIVDSVPARSPDRMRNSPVSGSAPARCSGPIVVPDHLGDPSDADTLPPLLLSAALDALKGVKDSSLDPLAQAVRENDLDAARDSWR